ncbi:MAG TPA: serine hydrolase domain-containing protein [Nocardioidaceae bacterium]
MTEEATGDRRSVLVADAHTKGRLPGIVAATSRDGVVDWRCVFGDTGAAYRIASITKTFTAVAVMQLRDEGRIDLDEAIGRHVPETPYADQAIRRLLSHSSGMTAEPAGPWWERVPGGSWSELVAANRRATHVFKPGERYHYSNLGYGLLGELVARLRGRSWWDVVTERIVEPVGLTGTTFARPDDAAVGTSRNPLTDELVREPSEDEGAMAAAGQLWSTPDDLLRWVDVLAAGHPGVLSADTAVEMRTVQSGDPDLQHRGAYGLGLRLRWSDQATLIGHSGSLPGFLAGMFADPVSRVGAVVLTDATYGLDPEGVCASLIESAPPAQAQPPVADPASPATDLAGAWYWGNVPFELVPTASGAIVISGANRSRIEQVGVDVYRGLNGYWAGELLHVHRDADGRARHLDVVTFILTRTPYDPKAPIPGRTPEPL